MERLTLKLDCNTTHTHAMGQLSGLCVCARACVCGVWRGHYTEVATGNIVWISEGDQVLAAV